MNNLKEIKTTIIGSILFLIGVGMAVKVYFFDNLIEWTDYTVSGVFAALGIMFLLAPDRALNFLFKKADKKIE